MKDSDTARQVWKALCNVFERKGIKNQLFLRKQLLTMKLNDNSCLQNHFLDFVRKIRELKACGAKLEEVNVVCHLLLTLPKTFDSTVTMFDAIEEEKLMLNFVKSKLLDTELKQKGGNRNITNVGTAFTGKMQCKI